MNSAPSARPTDSAFHTLRWRVRQSLLVEGLGLLLGALLVYLAVTLPLDRWLRLERVVRLLLLATAVAVVLRWLLRRVLVPLRLPLNAEELALAVERRNPRLQQKLISAVQFRQRLERFGGLKDLPDSPDLMRAVVAGVDEASPGIPFASAIDQPHVTKMAAVAIASFVLLGSSFLSAPDTLRLWAARNLGLSAVEWPRRTHLRLDGVTGDTIRLPRGDDLTVMVRATCDTGVLPEVAEIRYRQDNGERGREPMAQTGEQKDGEGQFSYTFPALLEPLRFHVEADDGITDEVRVELVDRPRVTDLQLSLVYPDYVGRPPEELTPKVKNAQGKEERLLPGDFKVVAGSRIAIQARATKELRKAYVLHGKDLRQDLAVTADQHGIQGEFTPRDTGLFAVELLDRDDLTTGQPPRILIRVVEDKEPRVLWKPFGIGGMVTPVARIPGRLKVTDDYGLTKVEALVRIAELPRPDAVKPGEAPASQPQSQPTSQPQGDLPWQAVAMQGLERFRPGAEPFEPERVLLNLETTLNPDSSDLQSYRNKARPGTLLSIRLTARDNFGPGRPHEGTSEVVTLRVVTPEELLNDLLRRQEEAKRELELHLRDEKADRGELAEMASPKTAGELGEKVRNRLLQTSARQKTIGRKVAGLSDRYLQILEEMRNNRIGEESFIRKLETEIVVRLRNLADKEFPPSVASIDGFRDSGTDDKRSTALACYDVIIATMERALREMQGLETFMLVLEKAREVRKIQGDAQQEAAARLRKASEELFGPGENKNEPPTSRPPAKNK